MPRRRSFKVFVETLRAAVVAGNVDEIKRMHPSKMAVNIRDAKGFTLLHHAALHGHLEVSQLLLSRGAAVGAADNDGDTPIHCAAWFGFEVVARLLVAKGAAVGAVNKLGKTPMHDAARQGHFEVARLLLDNGAAVDVADNDGTTPLHVAAARGHEPVARLLLRQGAAVDALDHNDDTPLHFVAGHGDEALTRLLLHKGAAVGALNRDKNTPLHDAAWQGHRVVAGLLLDADWGRAWKCVNRFGCTPQQWQARRRGRLLAALLSQHAGLPPGAQAGGATGLLGAGGAAAAVQTYTYDQLYDATLGFHKITKLTRRVSEFGGVLDGAAVVVRCLKRGNVATQDCNAKFASGVATLSKLRHPHVVKLLGSCPEQCMLVYEASPGWSLERVLAAPPAKGLTWRARVRIAAEVADALTYCHYSAAEPIMHMDVKPTNILLSHTFTSKLANVGVSRLRLALARDGGASSPIPWAKVVKKPSYMDAEHLNRRKSDVHSLGTVMLRLLTGHIRLGLTHHVAEALRHPEPFLFTALVRGSGCDWRLVDAMDFGHLAVRCCSLGDPPDLARDVLPALLAMAERAAWPG